MNFSKLSQAQNLLKILESSQIPQREQLDENKKNMKKQNGKNKGKVSQEYQATSHDKNIAS